MVKAWLIVGVGIPLLAPGLALGYGEPDGAGRPNHRERLLHVFTNQVRAAPHEWPGWDTSKASATPRAPVRLHGKLIEAARFHADDMAEHNCFQHESCDGTTFEVRVDRFFNGAGAGENIYTAIGIDDERSAITGWMNSDGHRRNILTEDWTDLGTGFAARGGQVYYVQDFGLVSQDDRPPIVGAARELLGSEVRLYANVYASDGQAPTEIAAVVEGTRTPMTLIAGRPGNATYAVTIPTPDCAKVHYTITPAGGSASTFPSTGSLLVGKACSAEFSSDRSGGPNGPADPGQVVIDASSDRGCRATGTSGHLPFAGLALGLLLLLRRGRRLG
ncbi:MAG: CAP domain-containing protein [Deltaproteobacteria bacterium]|jgi:hypothetical protein|nr:CAP domain-containing protein [Deltaproteobacteria bacterium]